MPKESGSPTATMENETRTTARILQAGLPVRYFQNVNGSPVAFGAQIAWVNDDVQENVNLSALSMEGNPYSIKSVPRGREHGHWDYLEQ